ncbi:MAG: hypothetical protein JXD23_13080 [Spirochaetales bacterium]|nr:hypothetical protein [Spirochaetales bacterium]
MNYFKLILPVAAAALLSWSCPLLLDKTVAAPLSVAADNPYHWDPGPTKVYDPGDALVTWTIDLSGTVYPSYGDVYYNTVNDFSTASVSHDHPAGSATLHGLTSGQTYYFWVVSYGEWAGQYYYSQPTGPVSPPLAIQ